MLLQMSICPKIGLQNVSINSEKWAKLGTLNWTPYILNYIYGLVNGFGHMWFLPMLLWCFVATYFLLKVRMKEEIKLIGLLCLSIFPSSLIPLPFRMASTMYYLFYFYLAYYIWNHRKLVIKYLATNKIIISGSILFLIVLFHLTLYYEIIHYHIRL